VKTSDARRLLRAAAAATKNAYAPYSRFRVGAALLTAGGEIVTGCNVENVSYGLTICAERSAVFAAVARRLRKIQAVAIVASGPKPPYPCGACRQVLAEFCPASTPVILAPLRRLADFEETTLGELLPKSFKL